MHDESSFLEAMQEDPSNLSLRLVFADWLEERGDPRGELIRLLNTLTQSVEVPDRGKLEDRLRGLLASGVQPVGPFWTNSIGMKFAWIPAGTFLMGSPEEEEGRHEGEIQHKVVLAKGFFMAIHPVTQACWRQVVNNQQGRLRGPIPSHTPSHFRGDDLPVEQVSWHDCEEFLRRLTDQEGHAYRLPTEAEWEYACRAGTTTPFYFGQTTSTDLVNYNGIAYGKGKKGVNRERTTSVGSFPPNAWGLFDMHGNVREWCADWFGAYPKRTATNPKGAPDGDRRVVRGGSFGFGPIFVRSSHRVRNVPSFRNANVGFRPVRIAAR